MIPRYIPIINGKIALYSPKPFSAEWWIAISLTTVAFIAIIVGAILTT